VSDLLIGQQRPQDLLCESKSKSGLGVPLRCMQPATHAYGPECETTTGKLMYLCQSHATFIKLWKAEHANDPVECPTHGRIGKVKDYLILTRMS
jgi:hypothetical protein